MHIGRRGYIESAKWLYHSWLGAWLCVRATHCHGRPLSTEVNRCGWKATSCVESQRCACNAISSTSPYTSAGAGGRPGVGLFRNTGFDLAAATRLLNGAPGRVSAVAATHGGVATLPALAGGDNRCVVMTTTARDPNKFGCVKRFGKRPSGLCDVAARRLRPKWLRTMLAAMTMLLACESPMALYLLTVDYHDLYA